MTRLTRHSEIYGEPTTSGGWPVGWEPASVVDEDLGRLQTVVEGTDITFLLDAPTPHPTIRRAEPFGSYSAEIPLPQVSGFRRPGVGALSWCRKGANVDIRVKKPGGSSSYLFAGLLIGFGHDEDTGVFTLRCIGALYQGDLQIRTPGFDNRPKDCGYAIRDALNSVIGRRYSKMPRRLTGTKTSTAGQWEPRLSGYVTELLATMTKGDRQWTVACPRRNPALVLKDTTTVQWTVRNGARGIGVRLEQDATQAPNVIYGEGIREDGGRWRNAKYPNWRPDDTPEYPGPLSPGMTVGYTDAQSSSGRGVSAWQEKAGQRVTGVLSRDDQAAWRRIQTDAGITVNNFLGPQTWAATFNVGSNTGTLDGAWIAPLAASRKVVPRLYGPDGDDLGPNPDYDPAILRVERYINFGPGVSKADGRKSARATLARDIRAGWAGEIAFQLDPEEGSRYDIREGHNIRIRGFRGGADLLVHVSGVTYSEDAVTCLVDTNARDFPTLQAVLDRERAAVDPARAYQRTPTSGSMPSDRATWDSESPAGRIPRLALFGGLWTVIRIPVAAYGTVVRSRLTTSSPATPFSVAVFDRPVTSSQLVSLVGNPLSQDDNPWSEKADELEDLGMLMAWGWKKQPAGYYPREYSTPDNVLTAPVTGRMVDDASWDFASSRSPWLWVAMIARDSTWIEGRFLHGAD